MSSWPCNHGRRDAKEISMTSIQGSGRQAILAQARQLFFARGYHGVSVRDIVQACGLSNAALYHHFGSKDHLFVEVFEGHIAQIMLQLRAAAAVEGSCRERLSTMAEAYARIMLESQSELQALHRDLTACDTDERQRLLFDAQWQIPSLFAAVIEEGMAAGEVRAVDAQRVSMLLMGMVLSLVLHRRFEAADGTLADDIKLIMQTLFEGIGT
jgi:AcrR family transcriptional regulator